MSQKRKLQSERSTSSQKPSAALTYGSAGAVLVGALLLAGSRVSSDDEGGGWAVSAEVEAEFGMGDACDFDRVTAASMTNQRFRQNYSLQQPFVITDAVDPNDKADYAKAALEQAYGGASVRVGIAREIIRASGTGYHGMSLNRFLHVMSDRDHIGGDALYVFDKGKFFDHEAPKLKARINSTLLKKTRALRATA